MGRSTIKRFGLGLGLLAVAFWFSGMGTAYAVPAATGLSDPALQPKFVEPVPNALDPGFKYKGNKDKFRVDVAPSVTMTGLVGTDGMTPVPTPIFGYGQASVFTWPGKTFEIMQGLPGQTVEVMWRNKLWDEFEVPVPHLLPVDTSLHWAYSLHGDSSANGVDYRQFSIEQNGVPIVVHLHGGHTDAIYDGNPEYFFSPGWEVRGPRWVEKKYLYDKTQGAGSLWYHDHALGITRLNVYAGMAGFYFVRDNMDTGTLGANPLNLPVFPYEMALAIQDRMFSETGELFYPAFPGDPFYDDFITGEGAVLPPDIFPGGGPTALAEFFGDHMVVNGKIWPKADVQPRNYRLRLLNGCDSRFLVIQFVSVDAGITDPEHMSASEPLPFTVIGSDQGFAKSSTTGVTQLVFEPGGRYDVIFDFKGLQGKRVILKNLGGDAPFGGDFGDDLVEEDLFPNRQTDRIMAFDVANTANATGDGIDPIPAWGGVPEPNPMNPIVRKVALFEGKDEFGRLQPLLGTVEDDLSAATAYTWFLPTTENPTIDTTETWEIYNFTGDAHPIHLHLVNFEILDRNEITFTEGDPVPVLQHTGDFGEVAAISDIMVGPAVSLGPVDGYVENAPKDMVTALPGQCTRIRALFDKLGRYVWHCHILSHEDHEMMRVLQVEPGMMAGAAAASAPQISVGGRSFSRNRTTSSVGGLTAQFFSNPTSATSLTQPTLGSFGGGRRR